LSRYGGADLRRRRNRYAYAGQSKVAFAAVKQEDYGVLAAMLSSFGTSAGTIGTTMAVALMEIDGGQKLWTQPGAFAGAQNNRPRNKTRSLNSTREIEMVIDF